MPISTITPQLRTTNLDAAIEFYVTTLGFALEFRYSDFYAGLRLGKYTLHLKLVDEPDPSIAYVAREEHLHLYLSTTDVDAEAERLRRLGVAFLRDVADTDWGTREFWVRDPDGHTLSIGQRVADGV